MFEGLQSGQLVINIAYALVGLATFVVTRMLVQEQEARAAQESLEESRDRPASNPLVRLLRPFFSQYVVPMIRGKPFWDKYRITYRRKIISAGMRDEFTPDEFISFKIINILFFPIALGFLKALDFIDAELWVILVSAPIGWFYPDIWTNGKIKRRQKDIRKSMPFVIDLLALSTEAGLDFSGAMQKVVEKAQKSPLIDEFSQVLREIRLGSSRGEALREMSNRVDMSEIGSFVSILISADQMGASIGKVLRQQSDSIRSARFLAAEREGAKAAQKLLAPVMIFIVPAVFLILLGPTIIQFFQGGLF